MRIRISKYDTDLIDQFTKLYDFEKDGVIARIAFSLSLQFNKKFSIGEDVQMSLDGRDWRDEKALFGTSSDDRPYYVIYKAMLDQHYETTLLEEDFTKLFRLHLNFGLEKIKKDLLDKNIAGGYHISYLMTLVKNGLSLTSESSPITLEKESVRELGAYSKVITLKLGEDESGKDVLLRINDLNEFDSCNMAIAGMVGSGKTELVKDLLYQISKQSQNDLKFIFFDYKGEGNPDRLKSFLEGTDCKMVDLTKGAFQLNPLSFVSLTNKRTQEFNIKSFVDFVLTISSGLGVKQRHILQTVITDCFERNELKNLNIHPSLQEVFEALQEYYEENGISPDTLYANISDLATNIFSNSVNPSSKRIYEESLYLNLPIELSDTLRQLCVFLTLKYLLAEFSSSNDTEPTVERIKPLRYTIVIDEAHVYLKNKNASKALEEILRILRSKGVVVIMLSQGVEDYKTKNFDFSSQIKIPICLNINNKDFKLIESFVGTSRSKQKLQEAINKLEPQKGLINVIEPQVIKLNQFWKSISNME